jgi:peptidoglycan pentaglycine glycine transferase (the first glycine)
MFLQLITNKQQWDAFVGAQPRAQFTQSWTWGAFRMAREQRIQRLVLVDANGEWEAAALLVYTRKPILGGYWYAPRGPVIRHGADAADVLKRFFDALNEQTLPQSALFWRVEPSVKNDTAITQSLQSSGFIRSHAYQPASTLVVDLTQSQEDLLKRMHEKTRYNIRVAERRGVTVREAKGREAIETFLCLNHETAMRDHFRSMPSAYIRATYDFCAEQGVARIRLAECDGAVLAASMEMAYGDTVTYLYGASANAARNVMAPYALHWDAICSAKAAGYRLYDFHGVNPVDAANTYYKKSWEGITRFKVGWGGERVDYAGTWELPKMPTLYRAWRIISR